MFVIILANLPLPVIFYLNLLVTWKFWRVHQLTRRHKIQKPALITKGWWLGNISLLFALTPIITEHTIFIQNRWWLISFAISATLAITGLIMMNRGLTKEIRQLTRRKRRKS